MKAAVASTKPATGSEKRDQAALEHWNKEQKIMQLNKQRGDEDSYFRVAMRAFAAGADYEASKGKT